VFILVSLFIKINSKGRIIFKQNRLGKNGKEFKILKFRTMVENAESIGTGLDSYENDFRVTRIGKVLRNTSLDELPQLFNILIGDMSFIGPRPPVVYHPYPYSEYPEDAKKRFLVRPGVTGAAQVNGRNSLEWEEKFKFDIYYVENLNILLDIKIFFKTVIKVLKMEGSYDKKK
jgi:lipopolysaccharide/colanic/teichoic acid biosynthesis glycosyltransferase